MKSVIFDQSESLATNHCQLNQRKLEEINLCLLFFTHPLSLLSPGLWGSRKESSAMQSCALVFDPTMMRNTNLNYVIMCRYFNVKITSY